MALKALRPMLWTDKIQETIDFYTTHLDFVCGERKDELGWAALHKDDVEIMLAVPNAHTPFERPLFTGSFYIQTDQVDKLWEKLKRQS
jgi:hypothetical protein